MIKTTRDQCERFTSTGTAGRPAHDAGHATDQYRTHLALNPAGGLRLLHCSRRKLSDLSDIGTFGPIAEYLLAFARRFSVVKTQNSLLCGVVFHDPDAGR